MLQVYRYLLAGILIFLALAALALLINTIIR
jgi:hypothetical protein